MKSVRHTKKADKLLEECEHFFIQENGKSSFHDSHPQILANDETGCGVLYVYTKKDLKMLKRLWGIFKHLESFLPLKGH